MHTNLNSVESQKTEVDISRHNIKVLKFKRPECYTALRYTVVMWECGAEAGENVELVGMLCWSCGEVGWREVLLCEMRGRILTYRAQNSRLSSFYKFYSS